MSTNNTKYQGFRISSIDRKTNYITLDLYLMHTEFKNMKINYDVEVKSMS